MDVKWSHEDYMDICDCLHDNRLSREGVFKLKCLAEVNSVAVPATGLFMLPFALAASKWITGR